ncbi:hypothetical protein AA0X95_06445 [Bacillus sp. 1P10SD]|uniref:hypothetical protein n=1 Tax=Bacillus sp. 1P10SD TaxID=3132265 RepID=UPI0039A5B5B3
MAIGIGADFCTRAYDGSINMVPSDFEKRRDSQTMMPLPQHFDENEWFVLSCIVVSYSIVRFLPKRFPRIISVLLMLFGPIVARMSDHFLASPKLDLYNLMDTPNYDLFDLFTYVLYAPFSYLFIYFYDRWNVKGAGLLFYLFLWTVVSAIFEWIHKLFHVFTYHNWKLSYSFTVYLVVQCLELLFYYLLIRTYDGLSERKEGVQNEHLIKRIPSKS